jgi:hypothetical protein
VSVNLVPTMLAPNKETICDYRTEGPFGTVIVYSSAAGGIPESYLRRSVRTAREGLTVDGIGDEAYFRPPNSITVFLGDEYFTIETQRWGVRAEQAERIVKGLARVAVDHVTSTEG